MAEANTKPIVTITGMSGYIGSQTTLLFLKDGNYRVRGTVRDKNNAAKLAPLREAFGDELYNQLELVEVADIMDKPAMAAAIMGSTYVVHIASPFFLSEDEDALVTPAINGTLAAMEACKAAGVSRCVVTSSGLAVYTMPDADMPEGRVFNESHWSNPDYKPAGYGAYPKSKTLAERAAWDFQAALPEAERFEITVINPCFVLGPPLRKESFTSGNFMKGMMTGKMPLTANKRTICDVRDVAQAHYLAIKNPAAANRRFIICTKSASSQEFAAPIAAKYGPLGWPLTGVVEHSDEPFPTMDNSASLELGVTYHKFEDTMVDMADKMVEFGLVEKPVQQ